MRMRGGEKKNKGLQERTEIPGPGIKSHQTCQITAKAHMSEVHHAVPAHDRQKNFLNSRHHLPNHPTGNRAL